jgi:hypothetical protein
MQFTVNPGEKETNTIGLLNPLDKGITGSSTRRKKKEQIQKSSII